MRWYYHDGKEQIGPIDNDGMIKLAKSGVLRKTTQVWKEGTPAWIESASSELSEHLRPEPPPMPFQPNPTDDGAHLGRNAETLSVVKQMGRRYPLLLALAAGISVLLLIVMICVITGKTGLAGAIFPLAGGTGYAVYAKLTGKKE